MTSVRCGRRETLGLRALLGALLLAAAGGAACSGTIVGHGSADAQPDAPAADAAPGADAATVDGVGADAASGTDGGPAGTDGGADAPPSTAFKVVGYFPSWAGDESQIQFDYLTHINYAFILPTASGGLTGLGSTTQLDTLVGLAHAKGVKVSISVGGWNDGDDSAFHALAASSGTRATFVATVAGFVADHNLDGADIDWEYPDPGASAADYTALMTALATTLHGAGKILTAAVVSYGSTGDGVAAAVFAVVDFLNLMAYDDGTPHSAYSTAESSLTYWAGRGLPPAKMVLGVPFYGRDPYTSYADLVAQDPQAPTKDQVGNVYYNGIATIQAKTALAASEGAGIMIWELSMDTFDDTSLLKAIHDAIPPGWTPP